MTFDNTRMNLIKKIKYIVGYLLWKKELLDNELHYYLKEIPQSRRTFNEYKINVLSSEDTIKYILDNKCSVSRFGDGELGIILNNKKIPFQDAEEHLKESLIKVINFQGNNLLICVSSFLTTHGINAKLDNRAERYWRKWVNQFLKDVYQLLTSGNNVSNSIYGDAMITRPYMDWKYKNKHASKIFPLLRKIWDGRDILFIEGEQSRLGVGNDLFSNAKSIRRILCPSQNAFRVRNDIIKCVEKNYNGELILLALGPTATVLAMDFAERNMQAIDIGHIDVEYCWWKLKAKKKVAIFQKYVNEVAEGRINIDECNDSTYLSEIITIIR